MKNLILACSALALSCLPVAAQPGGGAFLTASRLLAMCKTDNPYCAQYIAGVADTLAPLSESGGPLPPNSLASFCPKAMTMNQAVEAFQKFAKANPEGLSINAAQFVGDALHAAYPCTRSSN